MHTSASTCSASSGRRRLGAGWAFDQYGYVRDPMLPTRSHHLNHVRSSCCRTMPHAVSHYTAMKAFGIK